ncbi:TetR/AcrR family transcriptional regulator [Frondihabitans sucicola]|nr:TetR/AcrR family transcriptional regulator [Frondihabitans sucicola]
MASPTRSRRERPAKPPLSRDWIIAATIEIMRSEGLEKATMRRVAQALDTGPASLYVYVANTAALHTAVLDDLLGSVEPASEGDWQSRLEALLTDFGRVLFAYPGLARSALVLRPTGPNAILLYDRLLGLLLEGRIEPARAAWGVDLLLQYVTANAAEHSAPAPSDVDTAASDAAEWDDLTRALRTASPEMAPHVAAHAEAILGGTPEQRVDWALRALVAGIATTALPDSRS